MSAALIQTERRPVSVRHTCQPSGLSQDSPVFYPSLPSIDHIKGGGRVDGRHTRRSIRRVREEEEEQGRLEDSRPNGRSLNPF